MQVCGLLLRRHRVHKGVLGPECQPRHRLHLLRHRGAAGRQGCVCHARGRVGREGAPWRAHLKTPTMSINSASQQQTATLAPAH